MIDVLLDAGDVEPPPPLLPAEGRTHRIKVLVKLIRRYWSALNKDFYTHFFTFRMFLTCTMVNRDNSNIKQSILGTWCRQWWEGRESNKGTVMFGAFLGHFNFLYPLLLSTSTFKLLPWFSATDCVCVRWVQHQVFRFQWLISFSTRYLMSTGCLLMLLAAGIISSVPG